MECVHLELLLFCLHLLKLLLELTQLPFGFLLRLEQLVAHRKRLLQLLL